MLRVVLEGRSLPVGAATSQSAHMAASVASRYALSADGVGAARPGARGSQVTASRYALGAEGGAAARPGAYMCSPRYCARFACWLVGDLRMVPSFLGSQSCNQERAETRSRSERAARAKYIRSQLMII